MVPHKTLYNRFIRWSRLGVFDRIFASLAGEGSPPERIMIDATHLKAHRTSASLLKKGLFPVVSAEPRVELNSKLHAVCDQEGRPLVMMLSERADERPQGGSPHAGRSSGRRGLAGRQGIRQQRFPSGSGRARHHTLHSVEPQPQDPSSLRCRPLQTAQPHRAHVRQAEGLETHRPPATIGAPTPSSPPSASQQPSSSGSDNES